MYAVIRTGGKQYRVAPGDVIRVEKVDATGDAEHVQFNEVLAISTSEGQVTRPSGEARVTGRVLEQGRGDKVLVFHYKRKKQYKKAFGHRQPFTAVQITQIAVDGQTFEAPQERLRQPKPSESPTAPKAAEGSAPEEAVAPKKERKTAKGGRTATAGAGKTATTRHAGGAKVSGTKSKGRARPSPKKK